MINIAELLKDAPTGMKLYSPLFGEVEFAEVMDTDYVPIRVIKRGYGLRFDECGRYMGNEYPDSECLLFPSKDCRTWEGWKLPVEPKFKVGDWVVSPNGSQYLIAYIDKEDNRYFFEINEYTGEPMNYEDVQVVDGQYHLWTIADAKDGDVLMTTSIRNCPFIYRKTTYNNDLAYYYAGVDGNEDFSEGCKRMLCCHFGSVADVVPATKEQRDLLFAKMKEAGYQWDADKKELHKIKSHYDISNFHTGMPVLVRDYDNSRWSYVQFSHYVGEECGFKFNACGIPYIQCIPFNDDTKHLLGTTDMPSEEYINW